MFVRTSLCQVLHKRKTAYLHKRSDLLSTGELDTNRRRQCNSKTSLISMTINHSTLTNTFLSSFFSKLNSKTKLRQKIMLEIFEGQTNYSVATY